MSVLLLTPTDEDSLIDDMHYQLTGTGTQSHLAPPHTELMTVGQDRPNPLPDPSVGGENGSGHVYGYSTGFKSYRSSHQPFMGAVLSVPAEQLVVQGQVGTSNLAGRTYAGVASQLTQYNPSQADYVASYVGPLNPAVVTTTNGA